MLDILVAHAVDMSQTVGPKRPAKPNKKFSRKVEERRLKAKRLRLSAKQRKRLAKVLEAKKKKAKVYLINAHPRGSCYFTV